MSSSTGSVVSAAARGDGCRWADPVDESCGAAVAEAAEGVHPSRAGLGLLPGVGAVPKLGVMQACSAWSVVFTAWVSLGRLVKHCA
jgi:hypothetical protein